MEVHIATEADIPRLIPALTELRPHRSPEYFLEKIPLQFKEGFQIIYVGNETMAYAVAGFRTIHFLFSGKTLYVDDLVTHSAHQRKGYGGMLMRWMIQYAKENGYEMFSLDSGFQRKDAHRLYLHTGLHITSFHFSRPVAEL
jgi:GNAT superfamily N-acetyltransferase